MILDEAHLLEDVATQYFGIQVSSHRVEDLCRDVERELKAARLDAREVQAELDAVRHRAETLLQDGWPRAAGHRLGPGWMSPRVAEEATALLAAFEGLRTALLAVPERPEPLTALAARAQGARAGTSASCSPPRTTATSTSWRRAAGACSCAPRPSTSPRACKELLFDQVRAAVLTSATLAVDGGFDYLKSRLGLEPTDELLLASPFDYARAGHALRAARHAGAAVAALRRARRGRGRAPPRDEPRAAPSCSSPPTPT